MDLNRNDDSGSSAAVESVSDLLHGFDIQDDVSRDFLLSLITGGHVPGAELSELFELALMRGKEEWDMIFACAGALRTRSLGGDQNDPGLAPYLAYVLSGQAAKEELTNAGGKEHKKRQRKRAEPKRKTSRFWQDERAVDRKPDEISNEKPSLDGDPGPSTRIPVHRSNSTVEEDPVALAEPSPGNDPSPLLESSPEETATAQVEHPASSSPLPPSPILAHYHSPVLKRTHSFRSPFFTPSPAKKPPRPPRGTISSLPFPPLSSPRFGLIQESLCHEPFRLLVAVTFLIRTTGRAAIPVFRQVMDRFPTPEAFVAADVEAELVPMIAHLGLPAVRCAAIGKYARTWTERPPEPGVTYVVRGYPGRRAEDAGKKLGGEDGEYKEGGSEGGGDGGDTSPRDERSGSEMESKPANPETPKRKKFRLNTSEWEIGHLTQGRYAIDSWRIFCRDIFLGKSDDWMGSSERRLRAPSEGASFEPEWMRVLPEDKELRACLRWMWMREGYEWDPVSGEKRPLRAEMRTAVDEGRIKYDEKGELVILDEPVGGAESG